MKIQKRTLLDFLPACLSLLIALGASTVFSACGAKEDGTWMHCHSAQTTVVIISLVMAVCLILQAFFSRRAAVICINGAAMAASAVLFMVPGNLVRMCMMHTMRCYTVFQPFVRIMAVILFSVCAFLILRTMKKGKS